MAGDWLKVRLDLYDDPAVVGMSVSLDCPRALVQGGLVRVWQWFNAQSRDGHADVTKMFIDGHVDVTGFADAMIEAGWMQVEKRDGHEYVFIPKWDSHNSDGAKKRCLDSARQRSHRESKRHAPVTEPSRTDRDKSVTREQKSRLEETNNNTAVAASSMFVNYAVEAGIGRKVAEGLERDGATFPDLQKAILNADKQHRTNRPGYIVSCIRDNYDAVETKPAAKPWSQLCKTCGIKTVPKDTCVGQGFWCTRCEAVYEANGSFLGHHYADAKVQAKHLERLGKSKVPI